MDFTSEFTSYTDFESNSLFDYTDWFPLLLTAQTLAKLTLDYFNFDSCNYADSGCTDSTNSNYTNSHDQDYNNSANSAYNDSDYIDFNSTNHLDLAQTNTDSVYTDHASADSIDCDALVN